MSATLVNNVLIMLYETISDLVRWCNYFYMYVGLCICSYMHLAELWTTTNKYTMVYHISCCLLPRYTMLASLVNGVVFMLCEWIPYVNSHHDFSIYVGIFIGSYMHHVKLCTETKTHTVIFFHYMRHTHTMTNNVSEPGQWCLAHVLCIHFLSTSTSLIT